MRTIIEHSNELFYIHDANQVYSYVSPTSENILGYTPEEMKIKWTEFITENPINLNGAEIKGKAIKTGKKQKRPKPNTREENCRKKKAKKTGLHKTK